VIDTYGRIAEALVLALRGLGIDARSVPAPPGPRPTRSTLCFEAVGVHEIAVGTAKVVGSAQLRRRGAFLQHGSILLRADPERAMRAGGRASASPGRFIGVEQVLGRAVGAAELDARIVQAFADLFGVRLRRDELSEAERRHAHELCERRPPP
jgi:lipoate-protein ligase A